MVQAILEGRKTQTRRIVKFPLKSLTHHLSINDSDNPPPIDGFCKYQVGDILWVRETFQIVPPNFVFFKADVENKAEHGWKPSIFMPKEACRLFLKIKSVRVERLHYISRNDAVDEGIQKLLQSGMQLLQNGNMYRNYTDTEKIFNEGFNNPIDSFKSLWQKINKNWDANPWVWVIEFSKTEKPL
jgi:hypothetical protein